MSPMPDKHSRRGRKLARWQVGTAATVIITVAAILVAYGAAASYDSLRHLAASHQVPLPYLNPVGLDGGLIGVITLDIILTWAGRPLAWLRFTARMFAAGTLLANAAAGWPDPVSIFLRIFAPALIIVITEAVRSVLLARTSDERDPIPLPRWILAPWPTFLMWRRMVMWQITSYRQAIDVELSRRQAIVRLRAKYPQGWRKGAPDDVVWMLRRGVNMPEALARVAELCAPPPPELPPAVPPRKRAGSARRKPPRNSARKPQLVPAGSSAPEPTTADLTTEARALSILADEPGINGTQLGLRLGKSGRYGRDLLARLTPTQDAAGARQ